MNLRNENIGLAMSMGILLIGMLLTKGEPGQVEGMLIGVLMLGAAFGVSLHLNNRDSKRGRGPVRSPFRR